ncbi:MAG: hypothetical protein ACKO7B_11460, partial [Flavobacteriales bacterium]
GETLSTGSLLEHAFASSGTYLVYLTRSNPICSRTDSTIINVVVCGCTDMVACNYNLDATVDDGSCTFPGDVCDDQNAATFNDVLGADCVCAGEIDLTIGCMNMDACNYNMNATVEDGSCIFPGETCDDGNDETLNDLLGADCICAGLILGCTDIGACNYNADADLDNGVCFFTGDG